jgi:hypothetical protein
MAFIVYGKLLETVGAILLAYVGVRAAVLEVLIGRHLHQPTEQESGTDLENLRAGLRTLIGRRKAQFGFYEAIAVAVGTVLIAIGCGLYLYGLIADQHSPS